jgi:hypothetical protein
VFSLSIRKNSILAFPPYPALPLNSLYLRLLITSLYIDMIMYLNQLLAAEMIIRAAYSSFASVPSITLVTTFAPPSFASVPSITLVATFAPPSFASVAVASLPFASVAAASLPIAYHVLRITLIGIAAANAATIIPPSRSLSAHSHH